MKQAQRLFQLYLELEFGAMVTSAQIADASECSVRTVYRDMQRLVAAVLRVRGAPRTGYSLIDFLNLPPLFLGTEEMRAPVAGLASVKAGTDGALKRAAVALIDKVKTLVLHRSRTEYGLKA